MPKGNSKIEQNVSNLADLIKLQKDMTDDIKSNIYGTVNHSTVSSTADKISSLVSNYSKDMNSNFFDSIKKIEGSFNNEEKRKLEAAKRAIEGNREASAFQTMINSMDSKTSKYEDLILITSLMPQLKSAKKAIVNSILSPDDFNKQIALNININDKSLETLNSNLYKMIKAKLNDYEFTKLCKHIVDKTVTLGTYYVAVLPYDKLFKQLIDKKERSNKYDSCNKKVSENMNLILEDVEIERFSECFNESNEEIVEGLKDIYNNTNVEYSAANLFNESVLLHELKKVNKNPKIDKVLSDISEKDYKVDKTSTTITIKDGFLSTDENKNKPSINGCKIKKLDPRRLISLDIDDVNLGYYYIENNNSKKLLKNPNIFTAKTNMNNPNGQHAMDLLYKSIGDLLWRKLDKKFIENNNEIKEKLYDVLKYADVNTDSQLEITYLESDEVIKFEIDDGESAFEQTLFFSRMYLMVLLSTITARVSRANDVRAYYVEVDAQGGINSMVYNAINTLQKGNKSILSMNHVSKMLSSFSVFEDVFIPKTQEGTKPIDFDIISGQNIDMSTDLLETLEQICVNATGVPLALLQSSQDIDFAKTYTMLNLNFMKNILDRQVDLNPSITKLFKAILKTEVTDEDDLNDILTCTTSLQSPMNLLLTNLLDQVNNAKDAAQAIADIVIGTNEDDNIGIDMFMKEVVKKYAPNIPITEFEELWKEIQNKRLIDKQDEETDAEA